MSKIIKNIIGQNPEIIGQNPEIIGQILEIIGQNPEKNNWANVLKYPMRTGPWNIADSTLVYRGQDPENNWASTLWSSQLGMTIKVDLDFIKTPYH